MPTGEIKVKLTVDAEEYSNLLQNFETIIRYVLDGNDVNATWEDPSSYSGCSIEYIYSSAYEAGQADFARDLLSKLRALPLKESND